jgi:cyclic pyranopterin phosphate synthase
MPTIAGEVAQRWRYLDGAAKIGVISSVTQAFCSSCTRMRLSPMARSSPAVRAERARSEIAAAERRFRRRRCADEIAAVWQRRADRYSEIRTAETAKNKKVEMSYIGG